MTEIPKKIAKICNLFGSVCSKSIDCGRCSQKSRSANITELLLFLRDQMTAVERLNDHIALMNLRLRKMEEWALRISQSLQILTNENIKFNITGEK